MATNLNPGADPQIAAAAYRAGMAGVPVDLRETFKEMGDAYAGGIEKMGEGLAKVAEVGAKAGAKLVKDIKAGSAGLDKENVTKPIWSSFKELAKKRLDIFKGYDGSFDEKTGEWVRGEKFANDEAKMEAKRQWQEEKDGTLEIVSAFRDGTMFNSTSIANGMVNLKASGTTQSILMRALHHGGAPIPDGPGAGCYVKMERGEGGKFEVKLYGPDGKAVSGFSDDGNPQYVDKSDLSITMESIEKKAETPTGVEAKKFLEDYETLEKNAREKITGLLDGSISSEEMEPDDIRGVQWALQDMGYNIDYTNKAGELITGGDAADGVWGDATTNAFNLLKADEQNARDEKAGDLWSDISAIGEEREQITINPLDIKGLVTTKDLDAQLAVEKAGAEYGVKAGLDSNLPFDEGACRQDLLQSIDNSADPRNALKDLMHTGLLGIDSFADNLTKPGEWTAGMWTAVRALDGVQDMTGDDVIDKDDFQPHHVQNMKLLRDEMLNPDNPMSKNLLIDFYTSEVKKKFDIGRRERRAKNAAADDEDESGGDDNMWMGIDLTKNYGTAHLPGREAQIVGSVIKDEATTFAMIERGGKNDGFTSDISGDSFKWDANEGQWKIKDEESETGWTNVTRDQVMQNLGFKTKPGVLQFVNQKTQAFKQENDIIYVHGMKLFDLNDIMPDPENTGNFVSKSNYVLSHLMPEGSADILIKTGTGYRLGDAFVEAIGGEGALSTFDPTTLGMALTKAFEGVQNQSVNNEFNTTK